MSTNEEVFDAMMKLYGIFDYAVWVYDYNYYVRYRGYHDGAWLEGYKIDPINYWGA